MHNFRGHGSSKRTFLGTNLIEIKLMINTVLSYHIPISFNHSKTFLNDYGVLSKVTASGILV